MFTRSLAALWPVDRFSSLLQEVFKQSDYVVCTLPGGSATYHCCGAPSLQLILLEVVSQNHSMWHVLRPQTRSHEMALQLLPGSDLRQRS